MRVANEEAEILIFDIVFHLVITDNIEIMTFNQSRFPRVNKESLLPSPRSATEDRGMW